jgi:hypothetical protein
MIDWGNNLVKKFKRRVLQEGNKLEDFILMATYTKFEP